LIVNFFFSSNIVHKKNCANLDHESCALGFRFEKDVKPTSQKQDLKNSWKNVKPRRILD